MKLCLPRALLVTINSFNSPLWAPRRGSLQGGRGKKEGCCSVCDKSTRQNNSNLLYPRLWNLKWFDKPKATYYQVYIMPMGLHLGFEVFFFCFYHWDFAEWFLKREFVVVLAQLVPDIIVEALASPLYLSSFSTSASENLFPQNWQLRSDLWLHTKETVASNEGSAVAVMLEEASLMEYCKAWFKILKGVLFNGIVFDAFDTLRGCWGKLEFLMTDLKNKMPLSPAVRCWIPSAGGNAAPSKGSQVSFLWWPYPFETFPESLIMRSPPKGWKTPSDF